MKKLKENLYITSLLAFLLFQNVFGSVFGQVPTVIPVTQSKNLSVDRKELLIPILSLGGLLTFAIRAFFMISGLAALFYLLMGAFAWVTAGGDKANVEKAQAKIRDAVVGLLIIVVVLAIMATVEQVIFNRSLCLGLTCDVTIPKLTDFDQYK